MGVGFQQASDRLHYVGSGIPTPADGITITGWLSRIADRGEYSTWHRLYAASTVVTFGTFENGDTPGLFTIGGSSSWPTQPLVNDNWAPIAATISGTLGTIWQPDGSGGTIDTTAAIGGGAATAPTAFCIGGRSEIDGTEWFNGRVAYWRIWDGLLTEAEILQEWAHSNAVKTAGLFADYRLSNASDLNDYSGNGRHLVLGSTSPTDEISPDLPAVGGVSRWQRGDGVSLKPYLLTGTGLVDME
jgi:hypothetical protein